MCPRLRVLSMKGLLALLLYTVAFAFLCVCVYPLFTASDAPRANKGSVVWSSLNIDMERKFVVGPPVPPPTPRVKSMPIVQGCPRVPKPLMKYIPPIHHVPLTDREKLLAMCGQTEPMELRDFFTETMVATLTKIGEGAFADVFGYQKEGWDKLALKIIPIEGRVKYQHEEQNSFKDIQAEVVVSLELSLLGEETRRMNQSIPHYTKNFVQIDRIALCTGLYPDYLLDAWDEYDFRKNSDNDHPNIFPSDQLFVMFAAENSGVQLGSYVYHSFAEAISILQQVTATIGVGESALEFEHRDMHRGNILVRRTHLKTVYIRLDGREYHIETHGVLATIVDYTLSRVSQDKDCSSFTDLNTMPWLFKGKGDFQFDVYRDMKNASRAHWNTFTPYTNVLWLKYMATKMSIKAKLKGISTKTWKRTFEPYLKDILHQSSGREVFLNLFAPGVVKKPVSSPRSH